MIKNNNNNNNNNDNNFIYMAHGTLQYKKWG